MLQAIFPTPSPPAGRYSSLRSLSAAQRDETRFCHGQLEEGEDAPTAAIREVREETGLVLLELGPELGSIDWYFLQEELLVHKYCSFFLMRSEGGETIPEIAEGITECEWLPVEEAMTRVTYENAREMIRAAVRHLEASVPGDPGSPAAL